MDKINLVSVRLSKSEDAYQFWINLLSPFAGPDQTYQASTATVLNIEVENYDLSDHQLIRLKLRHREHKEVKISIYIPRQLVISIVDGPDAPKMLGFDKQAG
jgi:hypothetical protein